jgi:hypothetical protein
VSCPVPPDANELVSKLGSKPFPVCCRRGQRPAGAPDRAALAQGGRRAHHRPSSSPPLPWTRISPPSGLSLPAMKKPREVIQPHWGVYLLKRKAERLPFTVTGRNSAEAIEREAAN